MLGTAAAASLAILAAGGFTNPGLATGVGFLAAAGLGMFGLGALRLPGWARRRRAQIEQVLARLAKAEP